jgi:hypothetical protein
MRKLADMQKAVEQRAKELAMQNKAAEEREQEALALKEENAMRERALRAEYARMEVCSKESSFHRTELKKKLEGKGERENEGTC